jgi:ribosome-binding factor A
LSGVSGIGIAATKASKVASASQPSQRQLRVGELVRHALAEVMTRGEVRVATALVAPLGNEDGEGIVQALNRNGRFLRGRIAPALKQIKFMPELRFRLDTRFAESSRIDELLRSPDVARDLEGGDEEGSD